MLDSVLRRLARDQWVRLHGTPRVTVLVGGERGREIWQRWLALDPVRMAEHHADALRSMRRIYLDAGRQDEFFLDLGAQAFSDELTRLDVPHTLELFDGKHGGISYRYPGAIRQLILSLREP